MSHDLKDKVYVSSSKPLHNKYITITVLIIIIIIHFHMSCLRFCVICVLYCTVSVISHLAPQRVLEQELN
jgi:hypothetical protein